MSKIFIEDPFSGNTARVDSNGNILAIAATKEAESYASETGDSFIIHYRCHLAAAASGALLSFKNTDSLNDIVVTRIYIDAHSLTKPIIVSQIKDPTMTGGTDVSTTAAINKSYADVSTLSCELKVSDASADLTYTGGAEYHAFSISSLEREIRDMKGTNRISQNKTFCFGWETTDGSNAVDGEIISVSMNVYRIAK